jgi:hypothetical protein
MSTIESNHPGDAEAIAAGEYLAAFYGSPARYAQSTGALVNGRLVNRWAVGDPVRWAGGNRNGLVVEVRDEEANTYHVIERLPGGVRVRHEMNGDELAPF